MKKSTNRVFDRAMEIRESIAVDRFEKGLSSKIDIYGCQLDQMVNQARQIGFDELVSQRIIIATTEKYEV